jgi:hypothetical protein
MSMTYGYDLKTYDDKMIEAPVEINKVLMQIVLPGAAVMNYLPFCAYMCSGSFHVSVQFSVLSTIRPFLDSIYELRGNGAEIPGTEPENEG